MQKDLITSVTNGVVTYVSTLPALAQGDKITFEIDKGNVITVLTEISSQDIEDMCDDIINGDNSTDNNME